MNDSDLELILKKALCPSIKPSEELSLRIKNRVKEFDYMKVMRRKKIATILIAAAISLVMSVSALAAWHLLSPGQVAEHFGEKTLAKAFESKNAVEINKTVVSGGFNITLLGITSGKNLSNFTSSSQDINQDRTYAVVSIAKQDGTKMPDTMDKDYDKVSFFVSPLIKGQKPWQVNIASMNGGYSACVIDGVLYRLIECDGIEMFADRGLYLCVSTSTFYDIKAFNYNDKTGEITVNPNYEGANALFDLPLDTKKADHDKAEKYLKELLGEPAASTGKSQKTENSPVGPELKKTDKNPANFGEEQNEIIKKIYGKELANAVVIPDSIKKVTYGKDGMAYYKYNGESVGVNLKFLFKKGETGAKFVSVSDGGKTFVQYIKDKNGVITGRTLRTK